MKGLLIKDFKLIKNQRSFLLIIAALCLLFLFRGQSVVAVITYASAMITILTTTTVSYDEMDNGMNFIFTFPVSRRHYVLEKYVLGILLMFAMTVAVTVAAMAVLTVQPVGYDMEDCVVGIFGALSSSVLLLALMLPLQLKFGSERMRFVMFLLIGAAVLVTYTTQQLIERFSLDVSWLTTRIRQAGIAEGIVCCFVVMAVMLSLSYLASAAVMRKKQF